MPLAQPAPSVATTAFAHLYHKLSSHDRFPHRLRYSHLLSCCMLVMDCASRSFIVRAVCRDRGLRTRCIILVLLLFLFVPSTLPFNKVSFHLLAILSDPRLFLQSAIASTSTQQLASTARFTSYIRLLARLRNTSTRSEEV